MCQLQRFHGPNGLLTQAQEAKTETEKAEAEERVQVEVLRKL